MKKSAAENLIKCMSVAVAVIIAAVMAFCADITSSAKGFGSNLVIEDTEALLSDISVKSVSNKETKKLISSGANVDVVASSTTGSVTSDGTAVLFVKMDAVSWWPCGTDYNQNFAYFFNSSNQHEWSAHGNLYSGNIGYFIIPAGTWDHVILTRNSVTSNPSFDNKYNDDQTDDIELQTDKNYISSFEKRSTKATWGTQLPKPTTYSISPSKSSIKEGETVTFTPSINYTTYDVIKSNSFSVTGGSSSDYTINNTNRTIKFNKAGTYTVRDTITYNARGYSGITGTVTTSGVTITVASALPDVASSVSLTSVGAFKNKPITLKATLTSKNDAGSVTYTFSKTSGGGGSFDTTTVSTTSSTASVKFTPTSTGSYTFKVVVSESNHNSIQATHTVNVHSSTWYVHGQWVRDDWKDENLTKDPMTYDEENGYFYFTKLANLYQSENSLYFRLYDGTNQKGGSSSTTADTTITTSRTGTTLYNNTSKALKITGLTGNEMITVYTDGTYVWYSKAASIDYNIEIDKSITHGSVSPDRDKAKAGEKVTLTIKPDAGYQLSSLKYNSTSITGGTSGTASFNMPSANVVVTATFTPITYSIRYYIDGTENTTLTPRTYNVESSEITLPTPAEKTGYTFSGWHLGSTAGTLTTTIPKGSTGNKIFYGSYVANEYTVTFDAEGVSVDPPSKQVKYQSEYGPLPEPKKPGYTFTGWYLGEERITEKSILDVAEDVVLKAHFAANPTITVTVMYNGVENPSMATVSGAGSLAYNGSATVTITPKEGYYISSMTGTGSSYVVSGEPWTKTYTDVVTDIHIVAYISDNPTVTVDVYYNSQKVTDKATVEGDGKVSRYGTRQTITVTPNDGYYISRISGGDISYTAKPDAWTDTFTVTSDMTISVYITDNPKVKIKYIDLRTGDEITNGDVAVTVDGHTNSSDGVSVKYNSTPRLNASIVTANSYKFVGYFKSDGTTQLSTSNPYNLTSVKEDTEVVAKFDKLYKITINWSNLDGLKIGSTTLTTTQLSAKTYNVYYVQGSVFEIVTTINQSSEYKLNAECFTAEGFVGTYNEAYKSNVTNKHYNCTVGNQEGSLTITPVPATYSGSGYWGENVLTFNLDGFKSDSPYYKATFKKKGAAGKVTRLVCIDKTNQVFVCIQPTGYTSFVLHRVNPSTDTDWNLTTDITIGNKFEYTSNGFDTSGHMLLK